MQRITRCVFAAIFLWGGQGLAMAQENSGVMPPPKVLAVFREFLKPGKGGELHEKSESAFVQAMARAKWPTHYFAANSVSGKSRALFFTAYDSFEAWEKDNLAVQKNTALSAALERASVSDGELLSETDASLLVYNEEQSLRPDVDIAHMRYFEISLFQVRPGHRKEWTDLVKLVKDAYESVPDVHWATYEAVYGQEDVTYVVFSAMKSASEVDQQREQNKKFLSALGEDGLKKLSELESSAVEFLQTNLFQFNPKMSYPPDPWVKADPDFWKPKPAASEKAPVKTEEKPSHK